MCGQGHKPAETGPTHFGVISFMTTTIASNGDPAGTLPIYGPFWPFWPTTSHTVFFMSSLSRTLMQTSLSYDWGALKTTKRSFGCLGTSSV